MRAEKDFPASWVPTLSKITSRRNDTDAELDVHTNQRTFDDLAPYVSVLKANIRGLAVHSESALGVFILHVS